MDVNEVSGDVYLKLIGVKVGLLINFNVQRLKDGIQRMVNGL